MGVHLHLCICVRARVPKSMFLTIRNNCNISWLLYRMMASTAGTFSRYFIGATCSIKCQQLNKLEALAWQRTWKRCKPCTTVGYVSGASRSSKAGSRFHWGKPMTAQYTTNLAVFSSRVGPIRTPLSKRGFCSSCHGVLLSYSRNAKNPSVATPARQTARCSSERSLPPLNIPAPQSAKNPIGAREMSVALDKTAACFVGPDASNRHSRIQYIERYHRSTIGCGKWWTNKKRGEETGDHFHY